MPRCNFHWQTILLSETPKFVRNYCTFPERISKKKFFTAQNMHKENLTREKFVFQLKKQIFFN